MKRDTKPPIRIAKERERHTLFLALEQKGFILLETGSTVNEYFCFLLN